MLDFLLMLFTSLLVGFRTRTAMQAEIIALRHQVTAATNPETKAARPQTVRPIPLGLAVTAMVGLAFRSNDRQT